MEFLKSLTNYLSIDEINKLDESLKHKSRKALLLNIDKMDKNTFLSYFPKLKIHPYLENGFIIDEDDNTDYGHHIFLELGVYYLQEPSAMIVSSLLNKSDKPLKVLDMCSAPGGKLIQFALNNKNSTIIGNDINFNRLQALIENIERMGLENVIVINNDFKNIYHKYLNYFDVIILDAPCSGSGMFRKDQKMIDDWSFNKVIKYSNIQKELIDIAYKMLSPNGRLIYSTCSYSYEENEEVILDLLNKYDDIKPINLDIAKDFYIDKNTNLGFHIFPYLFSGEGHYICLLKKDGDENKYLTTDENEIIKDDIYYYLNHKIKIDNLNILRYGVKYKKIYQKDKSTTYFYHYSHSFNVNNFKNCPFQIIELTSDEAKDYMQGLSIKIDNNNIKNKDYILLTYKNVALAFTKLEQNKLKNLIPKYLKNKRFKF